MRHLRAAATCAALALLGSCITAAAAAAAAPTSSVVLVLRPTSETALHDLATARHLSRSARVARLRALVPDVGRHRAVSEAARALGLTVGTSSDWSVRVSASAARVSALFGSLPPRRSTAAGRAYSQLPAALSPFVVAALPTSGRVARPLATASPRAGSDFRSAYSAPAGSTGSGLAVATVQLSGWNSEDLQRYADRHNIQGFDVTKQYAPVGVDGADPKRADGQGGDEEVALDQESILATAPGATQVAYFAPNNDGGEGYADAIRDVGKDAVNHKFNTVALSLSWGGCEASDERSWLAMMDQALEYTLAAGVTVFAASGDAGSEDCLGEVPGNAQYAPAVDFPASSPYVVGVGGVSLPTNGSNARPVGWSGSGGGESSFEPLPSWQFGVASRSRNNHRLVPDIASDADPSNGFCVYMQSGGEPADAQCKGADAGGFVLAGTSLASPTQAALLTDTLSAAGWPTGVGDIHPALYSGAASGAVTDVTTDQDAVLGNGDYHSGRGYDLVTGLGTPVWSILQGWLGQFDIGTPRATRSTSFGINPHAAIGYAPGYQSWSPPVVGATAKCENATGSSAPTSAQLPGDAADGHYWVSVAGVARTGASGGSPSCRIASMPVALDRHAPVVSASLHVAGNGLASARWSYADASPSSGLQKFVVTAIAGGKTQWRMTTTSARSRTFNALRYNRWHLRVTAYDNAGNASTATAHLYDDTTAFSWGSQWKRVSSSAAFRHSYARSISPGASAKVTVTGKSFVLYVTMCPACGTFDVYRGGHRVATVDSYSSRTRYRVPVVLPSLARPSRQTFVLTVLPSTNRRSRGREVGIDALAFA